MLEKCDKPIASITVSEPQDYATKALLQYGLPSPTALIRLIHPAVELLPGG